MTDNVFGSGLPAGGGRATNEELLISVSELEARSPYPFSERDKQVAREVILDASNLVRHEGNPLWAANSVPPVVKTIVRNVCVRYMGLIDGVTVSRAGDETEHYTDLQEKTGTVFLTDGEAATVRRCAGRNDDAAVFSMAYVYTPNGAKPEEDSATLVVWPRGPHVVWG
nr:MAG TPA: hypothetical protein [Siphoviridae sp. ctcOR4]